MNVTTLPLVAKGRNAGFPRPMNDIMLDRLTATMSALVVLKRNGFNVDSIDLNTATPTITIQNCAACQRLIATDQAIDYGSGVEHGSRWRKWQAKLEGVRVVWVERGH